MNTEAYRFKTFRKNEWLFLRKLASDSSLVVDIDELCKKHLKKPFSGIFQKMGGLKAFRSEASSREAFDDFLKTTESSSPAYLSDVAQILYKHGLGNEWIKPLCVLLATGCFTPPQLNLHVSKTKNSGKKERVVLELNPDTSLEDIAAAWSQIKARKKELWPNFKSTNLTKKTREHLEIYIDDLGKKTSSKESLKQVTDLDIVGQIWPNDPDKESDTDFSDIAEKNDRKRAANLRQIRKRSREKT